MIEDLAGAADQSASLVPILIGVATTAVTSLAALVTILLQARIQARREERQRKWDVEDRQLSAHDLAKQTATLGSAIAVNTALTAGTARAVQQAQEAIADNTEKTLSIGRVAEQAVKDASVVDTKLEILAQRMRATKKPGA